MDLEELVKGVDIAEYVSQYVELKENGGELWGLSPFKEEKTPSFSVRRENGSWYDFSSGLGGNLYTFVKLYHKCTSAEAVERIKEFISFDGNASVKRKHTLSATQICKQYEKTHDSRKAAKSTVLPKDRMSVYEENPDKLSVWIKEGISADSLKRFQVRYDPFSDRIVYPIRNVDGDIVNIGGRTLDPEWKEKGLRKYTYFYPWGSMNIIYGLYENYAEIKRKGEIILFEGCKSVLHADTWGVGNTGAILTSHLNPNQLAILIRMGCKVVFALDKDVDVRQDRNIKKLKQYTNVDYLRDREGLLDVKDSPVDKGKDVFEKLYRERACYR